MPKGIILALLVSTLIYVLVALSAVLTVPPEQLGQSDAPLALVYETATGQPPVLITLISLFAVINGALIQIIMASRLIYGMSRQQWLPAWLGQVNKRTQTPIIATLLVGGLVLVLALWVPLVSLAKSTSFILLVVFSLVNLALLRIKQQTPEVEGIKTYPRWIPMLGLISSLALLGSEFL
jgi:amino acid transporter